jgi:integrase/recombinase XerD
MSNKCPLLGRLRLTRTIVGVIQRFFDEAKHKNKRTEVTKKPVAPRAAIPNAGYNLTPRQVKRIIEACSNQRNRVLIQTLAYTGIRRAEITTLTMNDILWDRRLLLIRHGKGNKQRLVPIPCGLAVNLRELIGERQNGAVFQGRSGRQLSMRQVNRIVAQAGRDAGVTNPNPKYSQITCHLFRHTFARLWKDKPLGMSTGRRVWKISNRIMTASSVSCSKKHGRSR